MYIIAGLGNPTKTYAGTRHNVGFDAIDTIAEKNHISIDGKKHKSCYGKGVIEGHKVILIKPQTFMNLSGESIRETIDYYKIDIENLIVIYDDISLEPGQIRVRKKGSAGGHNGIKSIIAHMGSQDFKRIRIGIGEKPSGYDLADYVLGHFSKSDRQVVDEALEEVSDAVKMILGHDTEMAMNHFNRKK